MARRHLEVCDVFSLSKQMIPLRIEGNLFQPKRKKRLTINLELNA
jgi:hypothetical protein